MTTGHLKPKTLLTIGFTLLLLAACGTTAPTRFYILHPMPDTETASPAASGDTISIALLPVKLPERLNRSQIVTRQDGHQVQVDEFNRWAEPLDASVTTILAENLSLILKTDRISVLSRIRYSEFDYQLSVDVLRFDGQMGEEATLICRWTLHSGDGKTVLTVKRASITRPVKGEDYQDLVASLSLVLADLSREIAGYVSTFH